MTADKVTESASGASWRRTSAHCHASCPCRHRGSHRRLPTLAAIVALLRGGSPCAPHRSESWWQNFGNAPLPASTLSLPRTASLAHAADTWHNELRDAWVARYPRPLCTTHHASSRQAGRQHFPRTAAALSPPSATAVSGARISGWMRPLQQTNVRVRGLVTPTRGSRYRVRGAQTPINATADAVVTISSSSSTGCSSGGELSAAETSPGDWVPPPPGPPPPESLSFIDPLNTDWRPPPPSSSPPHPPPPGPPPPESLIYVDPLNTDWRPPPPSSPPPHRRQQHTGGRARAALWAGSWRSDVRRDIPREYTAPSARVVAATWLSEVEYAVRECDSLCQGLDSLLVGRPARIESVQVVF